MITEETLNETQWQVAHAIAQTLAEDDTDVNEFKKSISYFRTFVKQPDAGLKFFRYLEILVKNGRSISHSNKTPDYYRSIDKACTNYLKNYQNEPQTLLQILGWTARLMYYYKVNPIGEIVPPTKIEIPKIVQETVIAQNLQIEQILEAIVTNIKGKEVTYQIPEPNKPNKLTVKEPKKYQDLSVGQVVKVKITELKPDGSIKKVRCID